MQSGPYLGQPCLNIVVAGTSNVPAGVYPYTLNTTWNWTGAPGSPYSYSVSAFIDFLPGRNELVQIPFFLIRSPMPSAVVNGVLTFRIGSYGTSAPFAYKIPLKVRVVSGLPATSIPSVRPRSGLAASGALRHHKVELEITRADNGSLMSPVELNWHLVSDLAISGHDHANVGRVPTSWMSEVINDGSAYDQVGTRGGLGNSTFGAFLYAAQYDDPAGSMQPTLKTRTLFGRGQITVTASELSCSETLSCYIGDGLVASWAWNIGIPGLVELPTSATNDYKRYYSNASTLAVHANGWYGTPSLVFRIQAAATNFWNLQFNDAQLTSIKNTLALFNYTFAVENSDGFFRPGQVSWLPRPLYVNDMSLIRGGYFDVNGKWGGGHVDHRDGTAVDIATIHLMDDATTIDSTFGDPLTSGFIYALTAQANNIIARHMLTALQLAAIPPNQGLHKDHWHCK